MEVDTPAERRVLVVVVVFVLVVVPFDALGCMVGDDAIDVATKRVKYARPTLVAMFLDNVAIVVVLSLTHTTTGHCA
jgi:hypothetical protein